MPTIPPVPLYFYSMPLVELQRLTDDDGRPSSHVKPELRPAVAHPQ